MTRLPRRLCAGAWLFGFLAGLSLLLHLTAGIDWTPVREGVLRVPAWAWPVAAAAWLTATVVRAWRLQREWASVRVVSLVGCWRLVVRHDAAVWATPLRLGEIGYVWMVHREWQVSPDRAMRSLVWMRWQDGTVLAAIGVLLLTPADAAIRTLLAAGVVFAGAVVVPRLSFVLLARHKSLQRWRQAAAGHAHDVDGWIACACHGLLRLGAVGWLLGLLTGQDAQDALRVAAGTELAGLLPLQGPAGLGTYEGGAWLGAMLSGADANVASAFVGAALIVHLFCALLVLAAAAAAHRGSSDVAPRLGSAR